MSANEGVTRLRIDVHHHVIPPAYAAWLARHGVTEAGGRAIPRWTAADDISLETSSGSGRRCYPYLRRGRSRPTAHTTRRQSRESPMTSWPDS